MRRSSPITKAQAVKLVQQAIMNGHVLTGRATRGVITVGPVSEAVRRGSEKFACILWGRYLPACPSGRTLCEDYGTATAVWTFVEFMGRGPAAKVARAHIERTAK